MSSSGVNTTMSDDDDDNDENEPQELTEINSTQETYSIQECSIFEKNFDF